MIEGVKLDLSAQEMSEHAERRAKYHEGRMNFYRGLVKQFQELREGEEKQQLVAKNSSSRSDPVEEWNNAAWRHEAKQRFFLFASTHFVRGETYRLRLEDLRDFEIAPRDY